MYWIFERAVLTWHKQYVQAKLIEPLPRSLVPLYGKRGFRSPLQHEPYNVDLALTYQVHPQHPHPDNYFENAGFTLYSERLVRLMQSFGVKAEIFPTTLVDKRGYVQLELSYYVFHMLEDIQNAMDATRSGWTGDLHAGIPRLVLDETAFESRPIFLCDHVYVPLMRDDVKQAIQNQGITGLRFLDPAKYHSGHHGPPLMFDD